MPYRLDDEPEHLLHNVKIIRVQSNSSGRLFLTLEDGRHLYLYGGYDGEVEVEDITKPSEN